MIFKQLKPRKALNKAFLKVKPNRTEIEGFKAYLIALLDRTNDTESEEFHKNLVIDFLKKTYYDPNHFINTKGRNDLVIHNGTNASSSVGVIIEAKKPTNKAEMIKAFAEGDSPQQMIAKLNTKAFQELVLYYLRERITHKNLEVKHLVVTNINEWFIFDATVFDRLFAQNKSLVQQFIDFEEGRLADTKTDFFYKQIAAPFIDNISTEIEFTYFDLQEYQKPLRNADKADDSKLIALFKLLSAEHLLKLPFSNDSNSLDKRFYSELLHIIGLTETKEGGKKLIERNKEGGRHSGTILEDAIIQLDSLDKLNRLDKPSQFGSTTQERLFNVGLELCITWINRILFLKLLEAQLITYHNGDKSYAFLNLKKIKNYDDLNSLFFQVLARKDDERNDDVKKIFEKVPYLNSSLFEPTDLEQTTLFISNLKDDKAIPVIATTVLKDSLGKKRSGNLSTLEYLFEFLDAYDFGAEGGEEIQEDNKTLINASVLGLIFEKINGYKDGSFFTPGFITMYMCRETIRKAVLQKFNETKKWSCNSIEELYDKIEDRKEANTIVNSITICDPAVGSGHFLVSALNEMIAVKNDLRILQDREGRRLKEYQVEVVNDELIVTDEEGELFEYHLNNRESQRIQETLFHEKQSIIENCLFGVDINPNSVKICRLRLWIELLKNAYYKNATELETLPNIDINIKCGNSLVSRFAIDADLKQALKKSKWTIDSYRVAVDKYRNAENKEQKREMERLIADIKSDFRTEISANDPKVAKLRKLTNELYSLSTQVQLFEMSKKEKADWDKKVAQLSAETKKLDAEIEEIKANKIFENAFEWRFEFPEVLNDEGDFVGFDVVIGNPPYGIQIDKVLLDYYVQNYPLTQYKTNLYVLFIERMLNLFKSGIVHFIIPKSLLFNSFFKSIRKELITKTELNDIYTITEKVFEDAEVGSSLLLQFTLRNNIDIKNRVRLVEAEKINNFLTGLGTIENSPNQDYFLSVSNCEIAVVPSETQTIINKLQKLKKVQDFYSLKNGLNPGNIRHVLISETKDNELFKPIIWGRDIFRYKISWSGSYVNYDENIGARLSLADVKSKSGMNKQNKIDFALRSKEIFENRKIVIRKTSDTLICCLDEEDFYFDTLVHGIYKKADGYELESLVAILNSKPATFFYRLLHDIKGKVFAKISLDHLGMFPIPDINETEANRLSNFANQILELKKQNLQTEITNLENQIDQLVYQLYGLTEEEIKIVEAS